MLRPYLHASTESGGEGGTRSSSDWDDRMGAKIKTQKTPWTNDWGGGGGGGGGGGMGAKKKNQKKPWSKNFPPPPPPPPQKNPMPNFRA